MKLFGALFNKELDDFAKTLAQDLAKRYPPALESSPQKRISPNRITKVLEDAVDKAVKFNQEQRLGMFGKAKLGNTFRWELKELGYSDRFVELATEALIVYITRTPGAAPPPADDKPN
jgi:hypothetical protein